MIRQTAGFLLAALLMTATGCSSLHDYVIQTETSIRNGILAQKAWGEWSWCYDDLDHPMDFATGFKAGYRNVVGGGQGCQPTLPPRCYWKPCYETPSGREKINAWFDGYSHGALAAHQDGMANLSELPISPTARQNLMTRRAPVNMESFEQQTGEPGAEEEMLPAPEGEDLGSASDLPMLPGSSASSVLDGLTRGGGTGVENN
ncbi:MAG: hypothetical protein RLZZ436_4193 [Planctomycetota bacterium]|jgi:hypothetical protein